MNEQRRPRRTLSVFIGISCAIHAAALFLIPVGESGETVGKRVVREFRAQGIEFVKQIKPRPKPKPRVAEKPRRILRPRLRRRPRSVIRRAPEAPRPKPEEQQPEPLEARVMPPPPPKEPPTPRAEEPAPTEPEPVEAEKTTPAPEPVPIPEPAPEPPAEMAAMAPQPLAAGPETTPTSVDGPPQPGRRVESPEQPKAPSAPDLGNPAVSRPAPASSGDAKRQPQIGLRVGGREDRSALPGTANRQGAPESLAGPGGPLPRVVSPNPGGSTGGAPRLAAQPRPGPTGPVVRRGVPTGLPDTPSASSGAPGRSAPAAKRSPGSPGAGLGPVAGTSPNRPRSPGSGEQPVPAGPGRPLAVMTSPRSTRSVPPRGASGPDAGGTGGGGGGDIVLAGGGGREDLLAGGPGSEGGMGGAGGTGKSLPALGSPWGGDSGEARYARAGSGGNGPGGYGSGEGGEGTGSGGGVGDGHGRGVGTGVGDGYGPGSGFGEPILVAMTGPGGGYGQGNTALPLGWPDGTDTQGAPGFPWLQPGLGKAGGGGPGMFGGPHGYGSGGGYPGRGDKLTPGFGGIPGGTGIDIPPPFVAGGGGGGGGDEPGGPGLFGPLTVGGAPGGTGPGGGLTAMGRGGLGIPLLPTSILRPLLGIHGGLAGPGGSGTGAGAIAKEAPGGIYADLVGTFDIPVGVTNSDYNTDEISVLNLLGVMRDRTNVRVTIDNRYVPIAYDDIRDTPMLWISGHKPLSWTPEERAALKQYVEAGGTLLIEDCHGPFEQVMPKEIRRTFGKELEPVPMDDELFKSFYVMDELPAGDVQERLPIRGLRMPDGRLGVIYSSNDYSDAWKVPRGSYVGDTEKEQAYRMGINWYVYILAHWRRGQAQAQTTPRLPGMP